MNHSPLAPAFLTSVLVHLTALMGLALLWGALPKTPSRPELIPTEMVVAPPEPVPMPEAEPITPPTVLAKTDVVLAKPSPSLPTVPLTPAKIEPITPPKVIEKVLPKPARPKPVTAAKRPQPGPLPGPATKTFEPPKPGFFAPLPDEGPAPTGANTLGPSKATNPSDQPATSIEGGEAGAGDYPTVATCLWCQGLASAVGAVAPGAQDLEQGPKAVVYESEAYAPGAGGEGPGGGVGSFARPLGGYQQLPRYPESARRQGVTGTTTLLFEVLDNGRVGEVRIEGSAGHPDLDQAAAEAIKKWRFEPARRGNQPVAVWLRMPVKFVLR